MEASSLPFSSHQKAALRIAHTESSINMGGQELRILGQIRWLLDNGHAAWLLARSDSAIYQEACSRGLPAYPVPFRGSVNPAAIRKLLAFLYRHKIDLIDCHSSRDASNVMFARLAGFPVVRTQHIAGKLKDDLFHRLIWSRCCDRIIAVSSTIADQIREQKLDGGKEIDIIRSSIDLGRFRPEIDGGPVRRQFGIPAEARVVTVIGMIRPDKGQHFLVRAVDAIVEKAPSTYFFVVGGATRPEFLAVLEEEMERIVHRDRIVLTGFRSDVESFIAASDAIVHTATCEAWSQVVLQAFAMRKIVVAGNTGGIPEAVVDGQTGFLYPPGDVERLKELVAHVLTTDVTPQIDRAHAGLASLMGFEGMMEATLQAYRKALNIRVEA